MTQREIKTGNYNAWARDSSGFLKPCRCCGVVIYLKRDSDGTWRPYESWVSGTVEENCWVRHDCRAFGAAA